MSQSMSEEFENKPTRIGNFPTRTGRVDDILVQWCHGSPGIIYMLIEAHRVRGIYKVYLYNISYK